MDLASDGLSALAKNIMRNFMLTCFAEAGPALVHSWRGVPHNRQGNLATPTLVMHFAPITRKQHYPDIALVQISQEVEAKVKAVIEAQLAPRAAPSEVAS